MVAHVLYTGWKAVVSYAYFQQLRTVQTAPFIPAFKISNQGSSRPELEPGMTAWRGLKDGRPRLYESAHATGRSTPEAIRTAPKDSKVEQQSTLCFSRSSLK